MNEITITMAAWFVTMYYFVRAGGPVEVIRHLRHPDTPRRYKVALLLCALPIPGPVDEIIAATIMQRLARRRNDVSA